MEIGEAENLLFERLSAPRDSASIHLRLLDDTPLTTLRGLAAIGFDTNILKALRHDPSFAEQLFLTLADNDVAIIAPGQSIVEYWNNHKIFAIEEWNKFGADLDRLTKHIENENLVGHNPEAISQIRELVAGISNDLQESNSPEFMNRSGNLIRSLLETATMPRSSRARFAELAHARMNSKTPPGFADSKDKAASWGDFFVWCDFLLGVLSVAVVESRSTYLWVTDENKPDWKTGSLGHPFLLEEFRWVSGGELTILPLPEVRKLFKTDQVDERETRAAADLAESSETPEAPLEGVDA